MPYARRTPAMSCPRGFVRASNPASRAGIRRGAKPYKPDVLSRLAQPPQFSAGASTARIKTSQAVFKTAASSLGQTFNFQMMTAPPDFPQRLELAVRGDPRQRTRIMDWPGSGRSRGCIREASGGVLKYSMIMSTKPRRSL